MSLLASKETENYNKLNRFNISFDGNVAILATYFNKKTFIGGSLSGLSIFLGFLQSGRIYKVNIDGRKAAI